MRKFFLLITLTTTLLLASWTNSYSILVTANILDSYIEIGETFGVEIWADAESSGWELTGFGFDVDAGYDSVLNYAGFTIGPVFDDFSDSFNPLYITGVFNDLLNPSGNNVLLATLSFTANQAGIGSFSLMGQYDMLFYGLFYLDPFADFFDPFADPFPGADVSLFASVDVHDVVNDATPAPEPSTILLLGSGIAGLAWCSIRKSKKLRTP